MEIKSIDAQGVNYCHTEERYPGCGDAVVVGRGRSVVGAYCVVSLASCGLHTYMHLAFFLLSFLFAAVVVAAAVAGAVANAPYLSRLVRVQGWPAGVGSRG